MVAYNALPVLTTNVLLLSWVGQLVALVPVKIVEPNFAALNASELPTTAMIASPVNIILIFFIIISAF